MTPPPSQLPEWVQKDVEGFHAQFPLTNAKESAYLRTVEALEIAWEALAKYRTIAEENVRYPEKHQLYVVANEAMDAIRKLGE